MKKKWILLYGLVTLLFLSALWGYRHYQAANFAPESSAQTIALMPLDSRPCNTQYPQVLSQMAGWRVIMPPADALDDFLRPADSEALWQWLEEASSQSQKLIIFTNELFNGGLIHSRSSQNYADTDAQLQRLEAFLAAHPQQEVTLITILPRLKPSQFDETLWPYEVELTQWGQALDQAAAQNLPQPAAPADVPAEAAQAYLALFDHSRQLAEGLTHLAQSGAAKRVIIGQDDAETWCPSNIIYRDLQAREIENLTLIRGADELTMLLIADTVNTQPPLGVRSIYTDPALAESYFPYEAAPLQELVAEKLALAGLTEDPDSNWTILIHTAAQAADTLPPLLTAHQDDAYLGLADIAYTNKGDEALYDWLSEPSVQDRLNCYAGWNTAGNSLGTVFAHCRLSQELLTQYPWLNSQHRQSALQALQTFKTIRFVEDQIYQAQLSNPLRTDLQSWDLMHYTNAFLPGRRQDAQSLLDSRFAPYQASLVSLFAGEHHLILGSRQITYTISQFQCALNFPWNRAFEVLVHCSFELTL